MQDYGGPWGGPLDGPDPEPVPTPPRRVRAGLWIWLGLIGLALGGFSLLAWLMPGQLHGDDWTDAARLFGLLALISSGLVFARRIEIGRTLRYLSLWSVIGLVAVTAYVFRDDAMAMALKVRGAVLPAYAVSTAPHAMVVSQAEDGHFYIMGQVNGQAVRFLVDTGSSDVVLSPDDARRLGITPDAAQFNHPVATANGVGFGAAATAATLKVGDIQMARVPVSVNQAPMSASLLGMSFLHRLDSFEFKGSQLTLRWRG